MLTGNAAPAVLWGANAVWFPYGWYTLGVDLALFHIKSFIRGVWYEGLRQVSLDFHTK